MSDTTYELFQHYGTAAERALFTPAPAAGIKPLYIWYETDTDNYYIFTTVWKGPFAATGGGFPNSTYLTEVDETADLPNSRIVLPGTNVTFDDTVANQRTINAAGGNIISTGALGSEPGTPTSGDLYLPDNAPFIERYSGSIWTPFGPVFPLTKPDDTAFAWVNQGGASVVTTNGVIYLSGPAGAGVNWRIRKKAAPATPYTITAYFLCSGYVPDAHQFGMVFRNSGSGILHVFTVQTNLASGTLKYLLNSLIYSSPTAFGSVYKQGGYIPSRLIMMRIADDGINRICSVSGDGQNWYSYHSVARTTNLTADEVGFAVDTESATEPIGITLLSWKEA